MSYEALKISHTFSMDNTGAQTCLQQENMFVLVQTTGSKHMFTSLILLFLEGDSGEYAPTIVAWYFDAFFSTCFLN